MIPDRIHIEREVRQNMKALSKTVLLAQAKELGVKGLSKKSKPEIIHALQEAEGNAPCFGRIPDCGIMNCLYRGECIG